MTSATGTPPDPGERPTNDVNETTGQIPLPTPAKAGLYCTSTTPPSGVSGLLAATLCVALVITVAAGVLTAIEETHNAPAVTHTTMLLLVAGAAIAWISVIITNFRDRTHRTHQCLRSLGETVLARQSELYARQENLANRVNDLANRMAEQTQILRRIAADVAAVRREMADVIGVADADAELQLRRAVNDNHPLGPGLYVVPPEN
jgi:uncharacterized coiled-coil protein SlyX